MYKRQDIDNDIETLIGDDIDLVDIVWYGSVDSVHDLAAQVGVHNSAPMKTLKTICNDTMSKKRKIHFLPPYRYDIKLQIFDLLGIHPNPVSYTHLDVYKRQAYWSRLRTL